MQEDKHRFVSVVARPAAWKTKAAQKPNQANLWTFGRGRSNVVPLVRIEDVRSKMLATRVHDTFTDAHMLREVIQQADLMLTSELRMTSTANS